MSTDATRRRPPPSPGAPLELRLLVWIEPNRSWRAQVIGPDADTHEFASPFELARFVAWPCATVAPTASTEGGLR